MSVVRRHRIVERFLADMLGYSWSEADRLAPIFEHQLPQEVEDRLYVALDRPDHVPPRIPHPGAGSDDLPEHATALRPRSRRPSGGGPARIHRSRGGHVPRRARRPARVSRWRSGRSTPSTGRWSSSVDGQDRTLGEKVARQILVHRLLLPGVNRPGPPPSGQSEQITRREKGTV